MKAGAGMDQIADMVAYYRTRCGVKEIGIHLGVDAMTVYRAIKTYGGVVMRPSGQYASRRRNDSARPERWRCARGGRSAKDGVARSSQASYCKPCVAEAERRRYHRNREVAAD